jgi:DNA-binding CsgD family transcriptional regulator
MSILPIFEEPGPARPLRQVLTSRELEIVGWLRDGLSNRQIGTVLGLTENTVKKYLLRIFERIGCENRVGLAIRFEREEGASPRLDDECFRVHSKRPVSMKGTKGRAGAVV